jgi:hypothetical protein
MTPQKQTKQQICNPFHSNNNISLTYFSQDPLINTSYPAQSNHRNAAAQTSNRHGRASVGRGAVANLRKKQTQSSARYAHPSQLATAPSTQTLSITWPKLLSPQQETPPLLDSAQECICKQNVKTQWHSQKKPQLISLDKTLPVPTRKTKRIHSNPALSKTSARLQS